MAGYAAKKSFTVKFKRIVNFHGAELLPRFEHEIRGSSLNEIVAAEGEDIVDYANPI